MLRSKGLQAARRSRSMRNATVCFQNLVSTPTQVLRLVSGGADLKLDEEAESSEQQNEKVGQPFLLKNKSKNNPSWQSKQPESWVPAAYRGVEAERKRKKKWVPSSRREEVKFDKVKHEREVRLVGLYKDILLSAPKYRNAFKADPKEEDEPNFGSKLLRRSGFGERMQKEIKATLQDIHEIDGVIVDWAKIEDTEKDFRSLCRSLQNMCTTCTSLSRFHDENQGQYVDLAEFSLLELVQLGRDRGKLVESARSTKPAEEGTLTSAVKERGKEERTPTGEEKRAANEEKKTPQQKGVIATWFNSVVNTLSPFLPIYKKREEDSVVEEKRVADDGEAKAEELKKENTILAPEEFIGGDKAASEKSKEESTTLAHEKPYLESTHHLFRNVVSSIAAAAKAVDSDENIQDKEGGDTETDQDTLRMPQIGHRNNKALRKACEVAARRMLDLLDRMPAEWKKNPDPTALQFMMEMLCQAGSVKNARTCIQLYHHSALHQQLKYSIVLEAYLEAARFESEEGKRKEIVKEAVGVLHQLWNFGQSGRRMERVKDCSIVLSCISVAGMAHTPGICHTADTLARRAVGGGSYSLFMKELEAEKPKCDVTILPMVNSLTRIYASSGDNNKVEVSKQMLNYMMHCDKDRGRNQLTVFSDVDTLNAVLLALSKRYENKSAKKSFNAKGDLDYAMNLMDFMYRRARSVSGCFPDATTHELLFRLLDAANLQNAGDIAEELLSKMEIASILSQRKASSIGLSTYHGILGYYLKMAKSPPSEDAGRSPCERAINLLDKMEIQSTPMILSDKALELIKMQKLYDVSLRPLRRTYALVLKICSETSNQDDKEKAFDVAVEVHRRMQKQGFAAGDDTTSLLTKVCSFLPEDSEKRKKLEESLRAEECADNGMLIRSA